ncbi:hypothetical protein [Flavobacterium sp. KACC 22761]|nr:hypothetical protein [Flavobacterium sp. KACC 22761]WPO77903.1 hypothetical protein SCB73_16660 [Flavobacterium sp. KACC 22761]
MGKKTNGYNYLSRLNLREKAISDSLSVDKIPNFVFIIIAKPKFVKKLTVIMTSKFILFFILTLTTCFSQNITDPLPTAEKELNECIKANSKEELNCRKEYYHELQFWETEVFNAVLEIVYGNRTEEERAAFEKKQAEWKETTYYYFAKTMKEFQVKHPGKFVWDNDSALKLDARIFYQKNAKYYTDRISYLLSLVKKK